MAGKTAISSGLGGATPDVDMMSRLGCNNTGRTGCIGRINEEERMTCFLVFGVELERVLPCALRSDAVSRNQKAFRV